ncbi:MAG TPA: 2-oxoacid:ferredoxin oxidoreductase subunit beta [Anaerolineae bacterium]|nr:2-oxoacid:ferredoxin oxidoreductase subunit beta [Anaerolineae bacterium]
MVVKVKDFASPVKPTWCPGCGDYGIHAALKQALVMAELAPHEVLVVGGIGCGSKLPDYTQANGFMTLHGRPVPIATGARLANHGLKVITVHGDGDGMGLGMGHFIHTARRNVELVDLLQNNQIYGLTKGQYSPTSDAGFVTSTSPDGAFESAANPVALALTAGGTFIARGFAGDVKGLAELIAQALLHKGYALVDILQPCVTFNRKNTYDWYRERVYNLSDTDHDPSDRVAAFQKALEWGDRIPLGVFYRTRLPTYEEQVAGLKDGPVATRELKRLTNVEIERLRAEFV